MGDGRINFPSAAAPKKPLSLEKWLEIPWDERIITKPEEKLKIEP